MKPNIIHDQVCKSAVLRDLPINPHVHIEYVIRNGYGKGKFSPTSVLIKQADIALVIEQVDRALASLTRELNPISDELGGAEV